MAIKILNPKKISDIKKDKHIENTANYGEIIDDKIKEVELYSSEAMVGLYEELTRIEEIQDQAIVELYEIILGGNLDG